jgi:hypothetical protein
MKIDWIFKEEVKVCPNTRPTMLPEVKVVSSEDVVVVVHHVEEIILVVEAEEISSTGLRTSFLHVNFVARLIILCSSATSGLIQITWEKIKVLMQFNHMELIQTSMLTLELPIM